MRLTQNETIARDLLYKCIFVNQPTLYLHYKTQTANLRKIASAAQWDILCLAAYFQGHTHHY